MRRNFPIVSLLVFAAVLLTAQLRAQTNGEAWAQVPGILARIVPPIFPENDFPVTSFGAVGDGVTDCTAAISNAIATCSAGGGGRVVVPPGNFLTGAIHLKNNVNLFVSLNATLKFSTDTNAYPLVFTRWQGVEIFNFSPFIYALAQTNIAVTGSGTLDGQAYSAPWYGWKSAGAADETLMWNMASTNAPVAARVFGPGHFVRPYFVQPVRCQNVLIEGVTLINSPMWVLSPCYCTNVTIRSVNVTNYGSNTDGCDPDSCSDVLIENCSFTEGDDCIAVKSGRDHDGRRVNIPSQNIVIRNCKFQDGHGGITFGSEASGGVTNVFAENCAFNSPNLDKAIRFKSNSARGGYISGINIRNCLIKTTIVGIHMTMNYTSSSPANTGTNFPVMSNIDIRDCAFASFTGAGNQAIFMSGSNSTNRLTDVNIVNCRFANASTANVFANVARTNWLNNRGAGF